MPKSVPIPPSPRSKPSVAALDAFVGGKAARPAFKRLTFDISPSLHKRIRRACLEQEKEMAAVLREHLEKLFP